MNSVEEKMGIVNEMISSRTWLLDRIIIKIWASTEQNKWHFLVTYPSCESQFATGHCFGKMWMTGLQEMNIRSGIHTRLNENKHFCQVWWWLKKGIEAFLHHLTLQDHCPAHSLHNPLAKHISGAPSSVLHSSHHLFFPYQNNFPPHMIPLVLDVPADHWLCIMHHWWTQAVALADLYSDQSPQDKNTFRIRYLQQYHF